MPLVSVVIPTLGRPQQLLRAINSALNQTHRQIEVIVVLDRPDNNTQAVLKGIDDPRLRVILNPQPLNGASARNVGVDYATGEWVAFLDDDDEWLPRKIEVQLASATGPGDVLISCLSRIVTPVSSYVVPEVTYDNSTPLDEYLFDQPKPFAVSGYIQTSSYLVPRPLLDKIRFAVDAAHDDWDFILRLSKQLNVRIETVPEVLVNLYFEEQGKALQEARDTWVKSLAWIDRLRPIVTPRAYAAFCLGVVGPRAAKAHAYRAIAPVLYRAFRFGSPRAWRVGVFIGLWLLAPDAMQSLRESMKKLWVRGPHQNIRSAEG
jgi:glycosyltransferase involved in cell wall biosynthesis